MSDTQSKTTDEGGEDLAATIADLQKQLEKVNGKNKELVGEKLTWKTKAQEAQDAADEAATRAAERGGDVEALKAAHQRDLKKLQDQLSARDADLRTIRVDNAIKDAITLGNVKPEYARAVTALLKSDVDYVEGQATIEGKSIQDYAAAYFKSKDGQHFVRASDNTGGGATGSDGARASKWAKAPETAEEFTDFMQLTITNKSQANALADQWNRPDLKS